MEYNYNIITGFVQFQNSKFQVLCSITEQRHALVPKWIKILVLPFVMPSDGCKARSLPLLDSLPPAKQQESSKKLSAY
jgi:hypothetical protein